MQPEISVIIPVYNVDKYLNDCIDSILKQTFKRFEIICVDDCSDDNSLAILKEYVTKNDNIKIIELNENQGQSVARNKGLEVAKGNYIYFLDSDDVISQETLECLYNKSKSENLDMLMFDAIVFFDTDAVESKMKFNSNTYKRKFRYENIMTGGEFFLRTNENGDHKVNVPLTFFKRDFLKYNNLDFKTGITHEDNLFMFQCMLRAERVAHIEREFYKRRIRANSIMTSKETFKNVHGYFVTYLEMLKDLDKIKLTSEEELVATKEAFKMLNLARNIYGSLGVEELNKYLVLTSIERVIFQELVIKWNSLKNNNSKHKDGRMNFVYRKIRGGIRCYKEHGFKYTFKRVLQHLSGRC